MLDPNPIVADQFPFATAEGEGIRRVNPLLEAQWDEWLRTNPSASFFYCKAWASVLQATYGFTPTYLTSSRPGTLRSLLPIMEVNSWVNGKRGVSLPFTDECPPLSPDAGSYRALFQEALNQAKTRRWRYLECRGGQSLLDQAMPSTTYAGHRLDLSQDESALFSNCDGSVRQAIRKAERSGLTLEFSRDQAAMRTFHDLLCKTRKRHGVLPHPRAFFENIYRHVLKANQGWVVLARMGNEPVAGAVFFHFGKTAVYKYGASDERFHALRANNLVMWEAIKRYSGLGVATLDFGRTSVFNEGLRRFKLGWGSSEHRIDYVRFDTRRNAFVSTRDESRSWYNNVLRTLPIPLMRWCGAALYKHSA